MAFSQVTIQHSYLNLDGTPASGAVVFQLTGAMRNSGTTYAASLPVVATLNGSGQLSVELPANNDAGTIPDGVGYIVTEKIAGAAEGTFTVNVPTGAGTIDLASLLPQEMAS